MCEKSSEAALGCTNFRHIFEIQKPLTRAYVIDFLAVFSTQERGELREAWSAEMRGGKPSLILQPPSEKLLVELRDKRRLRLNRRRFVAAAMAAPIVIRGAPAQPAQGASRQPKKPPMKLGMQDHMTDDDLAFYSAAGVEAVCGWLPSRKLDDAWSVAGLMRERERVESYGMKLAMLPLPMSSVEIEKAEYPSILLGVSPDRDRAIDDICHMIRNVAQAGIPAVKYNMTIIGIPRTAPVQGRGRAEDHAFNYGVATNPEPPPPSAGRVTANVYWERITYFLDRVVPVAAEYKVKMACHPQDPGVPPGKGFRGVDAVLGSVEGLKRFVTIQENPYHGLNFCHGAVSEMLRDPATEIAGVIRYFGTRRKIFNVHFRNIKGHYLDFQEAFPDEGVVDMFQAMRVYKEVGYDGMIMPDHVPSVPGDPGNYSGGPKAFAYALAYIRGVMDAIAREG
jgi:mannonate dehydratase